MADLAVQKAKPIAEIPLAALQVASHFPIESDARLNMITIQPGQGEVAILRAANPTDMVQVLASGYADRLIRLPIGAVRWILKRHPEAPVLGVFEREIGVTLRTYSADATVGISCIEAESELLDNGLPEMAPDLSGLGLLFSHKLMKRILMAFGPDAKSLEFQPFTTGMRIRTEGDGWSAVVLLCGMTRETGEESEGE